MLSGPELARLVNEFEADMNESGTQPKSTAHHEVHKTLAAIEEHGNSFLEDSQDPIALDTNGIPGKEAVSMRY